MLRSVLKARNARIESRRVEGDEKLSFINTKVVVSRKRRNKRAEGSSVHDEEEETKNRTLKKEQK